LHRSQQQNSVHSLVSSSAECERAFSRDFSSSEIVFSALGFNEGFILRSLSCFATLSSLSMSFSETWPEPRFAGGAYKTSTVHDSSQDKDTSSPQNLSAWKDSSLKWSTVSSGTVGHHCMCASQFRQLHTHQNVANSTTLWLNTAADFSLHIYQ